MTDRRMMRTWAEVNLDALEHNYQILRGLAPKAKFLGLVKANAYGHGAVPVAKKLQQLGADMLAVACLDEAIELRRWGITLPILCLGVTPVEYAGPDGGGPGDGAGPLCRRRGGRKDAEDPRQAGHRHGPAGVCVGRAAHSRFRPGYHCAGHPARPGGRGDFYPLCQR